MNNRLLYETYHSNSKLQKKIISDRNFTYRTIISLYRKYLANKKNILDIGCGVGTVDFYLCQKGHKLLGVDISKKAINTAIRNSKLLNVCNIAKFQCCDYSLLQNEILFDAVIVLEVLEHMENDDKVIKKVRSLSKKGAIVIASSPSENAPLHRMGLLKAFDKNAGHLRRYSVNRFIKLFESNGFKIVELIKTEGILRNFLFTNKYASFFLKFITGLLVYPMNIVDDLLVKIFGESNYYLIAKKK